MGSPMSVRPKCYSDATRFPGARAKYYPNSVVGLRPNGIRYKVYMVYGILIYGIRLITSLPPARRQEGRRISLRGMKAERRLEMVICL